MRHDRPGLGTKESDSGWDTQIIVMTVAMLMMTLTIMMPMTII